MICIKWKQRGLPLGLGRNVIRLIPKPKKDLPSLDSWRPISLLSNDHKWFALIFAIRFKNVLDIVIDENQAGFMSERHISDNIRLLLDFIDYSDLINDDSYIFFLDFHKAFDTVEHFSSFTVLKNVVSVHTSVTLRQLSVLLVTLLLNWVVGLLKDSTLTEAYDKAAQFLFTCSSLLRRRFAITWSQVTWKVYRLQAGIFY